ncbi:MAG TPA: hydrogenase maturation protease [Spirochaetia bacterium]|nr:hydrogenase maturation protease [Spirochaetia bacterium]
MKDNQANGGSTLVIGYGNPGRQDDGLGPWIAEELEKHCDDRVAVWTGFQLAVECCVEIARHKTVVFVDAARTGPAPFQFRQVRTVGMDPAAPDAAKRILMGAGFTTHLSSPEVMVGLSELSFAARPSAWLLGVRGYKFSGGEGLSRKGQRNARSAVAFLDAFLAKGSEALMSEKDAQTKTILVVDDDADVRASLRIILESAGFTVGEAADGDTGMRIAERIRPDAIIVDLMMETVDAGSKLSTRLKASGFTCPIYLLSAAGDSVRYNIDTQELGLAGIFQKPADPTTLLATLRTSLKIP